MTQTAFNAGRFRLKHRGLPTSLVNGFKVGTRGWYRANLKIGHNAASLASLSGLSNKEIQRELEFVKMERARGI